MIRRLIFLFSAWCLFTWAVPAHADRVVRLATIEWPPYVGKHLPNQGFATDLIREAYKRSGWTVTITYMPWARDVDEVRRGRFDGFYPAYTSKERERIFIVSDAYPGGPLGFFRLKKTPITYTRLEDLKPYRIGVVRGYVNTEAFDAATFLDKEAATNDLTNFRKLLYGRLDLVVADKFIGWYLIHTQFAADADRFAFVTPPLAEKKLHICFGRGVARVAAKVAAFNAGLKAIKADGTLNAIRIRHGFASK